MSIGQMGQNILWEVFGAMKSNISDNMPNLRLHVFGHIHEGYGTDTFIKDVPGEDNKLLCVNACIMDKNYYPTNKPISIEFDKSKGAYVI